MMPWLRLIGLAAAGTVTSRRALHGYLADVANARVDPVKFWGAAAAGIDWAKPFDKVSRGKRRHFGCSGHWVELT